MNGGGSRAEEFRRETERLKRRVLHVTRLGGERWRQVALLYRLADSYGKKVFPRSLCQEKVSGFSGCVTGECCRCRPMSSPARRSSSTGSLSLPTTRDTARSSTWRRRPAASTASGRSPAAYTTTWRRRGSTARTRRKPPCSSSTRSSATSRRSSGRIWGGIPRMGLKPDEGGSLDHLSRINIPCIPSEFPLH